MTHSGNSGTRKVETLFDGRTQEPRRSSRDAFTTFPTLESQPSQAQLFASEKVHRGSPRRKRKEIQKKQIEEMMGEIRNGKAMQRWEYKISGQGQSDSHPITKSERRARVGWVARQLVASLQPSGRFGTTVYSGVSAWCQSGMRWPRRGRRRREMQLRRAQRRVRRLRQQRMRRRLRGRLHQEDRKRWLAIERFAGRSSR